MRDRPAPMGSGALPPGGRSPDSDADRGGVALATPPRRRRVAPLAFAGLLLVVAVLVVTDVPHYREGAAGEPGPAIVPLLIAALCVVAGIALVIQTLRGAHEDLGEEDGAPVVTWRIVAGILAIAAAAVLLELIGFFSTFTGLLFVTGLLAGARRWWTALLLAAVATWVVMIVFGAVFGVPLPAGPVDHFLGG